MHKYAEVLREKRKREGKTQAEYAFILGMGQANYARLERGQLDIKMSQIIKLCETLNISADELLGLTKEGSGND